MAFTEILNKYKENIKENADLKKYNTFRIGGRAKMVIEPDSIDSFVDIIKALKEDNCDFRIIGNGSNVLFKDGVYDGIIVATRAMKAVTIEEDVMTCECGVSVPQVAFNAYKSGLAGLERLSGIPGTIGGAVVMNAGAYGAEFKDIITEVTVYTREGEVKKLSPEELDFSYRHSNVKKNGYIVLGCKLKLSFGNAEQIKAIMDECKNKRLKSQPLEYPNAGSIFKKEGDIFAGKMIDECGLKGYSIGGAMVSHKHANFIVNHNNASCSDVVNLIRYIQETVHEKHKVELHTEVEII